MKPVLAEHPTRVGAVMDEAGRRAAVERLEAVIARERDGGCPMAHGSLVAPGLRRWGSYGRRFRRHKAKGLEHRARDLEAGLREAFSDHGYDPACLRHLARSFAEALLEGDDGGAGPAPGERDRPSPHNTLQP
jgi:hypothetical protein